MIQCQNHRSLYAVYFCSLCSVLLCQGCSLAHRTHSLTSLSAALSQAEDKLGRLKGRLEHQNIPLLKKLLRSSLQIFQKANEIKQKLISKIRIHFNQLQTKVNKLVVDTFHSTSVKTRIDLLQDRLLRLQTLVRNQQSAADLLYVLNLQQQSFLKGIIGQQENSCLRLQMTVKEVELQQLLDQIVTVKVIQPLQLDILNFSDKDIPPPYVNLPHFINSRLHSLHVYHPDKGKWQSHQIPLDAVPRLSKSVNLNSSMTLLIGGVVSTAKSNRVLIFNHSKESIDDFCKLISARKGHNAVLIDSCVYVVAGEDERGQEFTDCQCINLLQKKQKIKKLANCLHACQNFGMLSMHDRSQIIKFGGSSKGKLCNSIQIYNLRRDFWIMINPTFLNDDIVLNSYCGAAKLDNCSILIFGGEDGSSQSNSDKACLLRYERNEWFLSKDQRILDTGGRVLWNDESDLQAADQVLTLTKQQQDHRIYKLSRQGWSLG